MKGPDFSEVFQQLALHGRERTGLHTWLAKLPEQLADGLDAKRFPEFVGWWKRIEKLPDVISADIAINASAVTAENACLEDDLSGLKIGLTDSQQRMITGLLQDLKPWRKGPYQLQGTYIDTEWRSDFKWDRLAPHLSDLRGRKVLDVGGGSGYHAWRIAGAGAEFTLCIDPSPRYFAQFEAVRKLMGPKNRAAVYHLPLGIEAVPAGIEAFDTVLSMGVFYHRRSPIDHLYELKDCLRSGGELVLETLVIEGDVTACLMPEDRYAAMSNVWFLPSVAQLELWLRRCGFINIRCVDLNQTSVEEQRATDWMTFMSLSDFLDPNNSSLTREGYPAPLRAILIAEKA